MTVLFLANVGQLRSINNFELTAYLSYFIFYCRCLNKFKQEFVQDMIAKYGREHLGDIDMDS